MDNFLGRNEYNIREMSLTEFKDWTSSLRMNLTDLKTLLSVTFEDNKRVHIFNLRLNYNKY